MSEQIPSKIEYGEAVRKIKEMHEKDQDMRRRALANNGVIENEEDKTLDQRNTERMKEIIEQFGWPTVSKVGEKISNMAWLLVQHADRNVEFQKKCLALMKEQTEGEVDKIDVAYLEDRVRVNEGKPQLYGTQFYGEGEQYGPRPIEDVANVDARRKKLGMESLEEYKNELREKYKNGK